MNPQKQILGNTNLRVATVDLVLITLFASIGLATKNILHPLIAILTGPLYIPAGAVAGGLYMMWPVIAYGFIHKPGAASMVSLIQALVSMILPFGNFGLLSFMIYLGPGLAIDAFFLLTRHKGCCLGCCMSASAIANVIGTTIIGLLILILPWIVLIFLAVIAAISGCVGGFMANILLDRIEKAGFGGKNV